ncbi:hypothetical protein GCM10009839_40540 [Catenulispora yoronensis]|uniref:Type II toxin-antitoxin system RelE/ParE family toxin n=1 Tax=Catenulispora yoronensis TaxID=450799 RepID=A0ABP5FZ37_9ACTN
MSHRILWRLDAVRALSRIADDSPEVAKAIENSVSDLSEDPYGGNSVPLSKSYRRLPLGLYRVLYEVDDETVRIWFVGRSDTLRQLIQRTHSWRYKPASGPLILT